VEGGTAKTCRRDWSPDHSVPLSSRNQQVEQDRASPVLVHQSELARSTAAESRSCRQSDRQHENEAGTQGASQVGYQPISLRTQGDQRGTGGDLAQTGEVSRRMELQDPSQCNLMERLFWHISLQYSARRSIFFQLRQSRFYRSRPRGSRTLTGRVRQW